MEDEDLEDDSDKEMNYRRMCKDIIRNLNKIKDNLRVFSKFKLPVYQREDLIEINERLEKLNYSEYNRQIFVELMDISCQVEDLLKEIDSAFKKLLKKINNPSENDKREIYSYFKIEKITPELRKSSNEFNLNLSKIFELIQKIMDKYLKYYQEE